MSAFSTIIREYFEMKYDLKPFSYSELPARLKQEAHHLYHTKGGRNLATMWVTKEKTRRKWNSFGLLESLSDGMVEKMGKLYEAQLVYALNEGSRASCLEPMPFPTVRCDSAGKPINGDNTN